MEHRYQRLYLSLLALACLGCLALMAYIAYDEAAGREWMAWQRRYAALLEVKAQTPVQKEAARKFEVSVRQIVVPALNRVDRCVSCHLGADNPAMADAPTPLGSHPGKYLQQHPIDKYGCTVCHRGQGHSLEGAEAHAAAPGVHWDYPLLSRELLGSACGVCHDARWLGTQGEARVSRGGELFHERGCFGCHKLRGKGGTMSVPLDNEGNKIAQVLANRQNLMGEKTVEAWQVQHLLDPQRVVPESKMRNPYVTPDEALALASYLHSLVDLALPREYVPDDYYQKYGFEDLSGEQLYTRYCYACHDGGTYTLYVKEFGRFVPAVRNPDFLAAASDHYLLTTLQEGREGTEMPAWKKSVGGLRPEELGRLVEYLKAAKGAALRSAAPDVSAGDAGRGGVLFDKLCAGCHGIAGKGGTAPTLASRTFAAVADEAFLAGTIARGRRNTPMPGFADGAGLTRNELSDVVMYVRTLGRTPEEILRLQKGLERTNY